MFNNKTLDTDGESLEAEFNGGTLAVQHAGAQRSGALSGRPPAAEHFMRPRPLQRFVRQHGVRPKLFAILLALSYGAPGMGKISMISTESPGKITKCGC